MDNELGIYPSSFIPFCQFGRKFLGRKMENFSRPVCNIFKPTKVENQVCYSVNISSLENVPKIVKGMSSRLLLLLDYNEERSSSTASNTKKNTKLLKNIEIVPFSSREEYTAKIHLDFLEPYTGYGGGKYIMSAVKEMDTTRDFNTFTEDIKNCQNEQTIEQCAQEMLRMQEASLCNCSPIHLQFLNRNSSQQVRYRIHDVNC